MNNLIKINISLIALFLAALTVISGYAEKHGITAMNEVEEVSMPVIMYHSVLKDTDLSGPYVVTPSEVRADIDYLQSNGYTTVSIRELIDYTENNGTLPPKPIMLTFDDGCYNNYGYIVPMLEETGTKAVFSIVGEYAEEFSQSDEANLSYGYMRWKDLAELAHNEHTELANHSFALHSTDNGRKGAAPVNGEDMSEYSEFFKNDTQKNQEYFENYAGYTPYIYTFPFGAYSEESVEILKNMGFKAVLSCNEGLNHITRNSDCLFLLKRYNRPSGIYSSDFFEKFER